MNERWMFMHSMAGRDGATHGNRGSDMAVATPELTARLEARLEEAVKGSFKEFAGIQVRPVAVDDQNRHIGKTLTCSATLFGRGWLGQLLVLMPDGMGRSISTLVGRIRPDQELRGADVADGLGALCAGVGLAFGREFSDEEQVTVGMPIVIGGGDLSVMFSWGRHFETRLSFQSSTGPFWVILRLSHTRRDQVAAGPEAS